MTAAAAIAAAFAADFSPPPRQTPAPVWPDSYIGLPFAECNCAALTRKIWREIFGREEFYRATAAIMPVRETPREHAAAMRVFWRDHHHLVRFVGEESAQDGDGVLIRAGDYAGFGILCEYGGRRWIVQTREESGVSFSRRRDKMPDARLRFFRPAGEK